MTNFERIKALCESDAENEIIINSIMTMFEEYADTYYVVGVNRFELEKWLNSESED